MATTSKSGRTKYSQDEIALILGFLDGRMGMFNTAVIRCRQVLLYLDTEQTRNHLKYYEHAVGCVRKMMSDLIRMIEVPENGKQS